LEDCRPPNLSPSVGGNAPFLGEMPAIIGEISVGSLVDASDSLLATLAEREGSAQGREGATQRVSLAGCPLQPSSPLVLSSTSDCDPHIFLQCRAVLAFSSAGPSRRRRRRRAAGVAPRGIPSPQKPCSNSGHPSRPLEVPGLWLPVAVLQGKTGLDGVKLWAVAAGRRHPSSPASPASRQSLSFAEGLRGATSATVLCRRHPICPVERGTKSFPLPAAAEATRLASFGAYPHPSVALTKKPPQRGAGPLGSSFAGTGTGPCRPQIRSPANPIYGFALRDSWRGWERAIGC